MLFRVAERAVGRWKRVLDGWKTEFDGICYLGLLKGQLGGGKESWISAGSLQDLSVIGPKPKPQLLAARRRRSLA